MKKHVVFQKHLRPGFSETEKELFRTPSALPCIYVAHNLQGLFVYWQARNRQYEREIGWEATAHMRKVKLVQVETLENSIL